MPAVSKNIWNLRIHLEIPTTEQKKDADYWFSVKTFVGSRPNGKEQYKNS